MVIEVTLKQGFTNLKWMITKGFTKDEQISLNGIVYDFSVGRSSNKKEDILYIHQSLMIKNNYKIMFQFI